MKEDAYNSLRKRMKRYEAVSNFAMLIPDLPLYARIDGRHFSKLTRDLGYPFKTLSGDKQWFGFVTIMQEVAQDLAKEFKCDVVETHSDEISLGWKNIKTAPFNDRYFKLVSNLASFATCSFLTHTFEMRVNDPRFSSEYQKIIDRKPSFDCRIYQVPDLMELANCFVWRQNDCIHGAINQFAQRFFSHKQLDGKSQDERLKMCLEAGYDFSKELPEIQYGYFVIRMSYLTNLPEEFKKFHPNNTSGKIVRTVYANTSVKNLAKLKNKVEFLFESAAPVYL